MLAKRLTLQVVIEAPASQVWARLIDLSSYHRWNPFVPEASGTIAVGSQIMVRLKLGRQLMTLHPTVTRVEPYRELRWLARWRVPGLFDVDRGFQLETLSRLRCRFVQEEVCSGVLAPLVLGVGGTEQKILDGYRQFAEALRAQCELSSMVANDA
jgi:hypothetical protein